MLKCDRSVLQKLRSFFYHSYTLTLNFYSLWLSVYVNMACINKYNYAYKHHEKINKQNNTKAFWYLVWWNIVLRSIYFLIIFRLCLIVHTNNLLLSLECFGFYDLGVRREVTVVNVYTDTRMKWLLISDYCYLYDIHIAKAKYLKASRLKCNV